MHLKVSADFQRFPLYFIFVATAGLNASAAVPAPFIDLLSPPSAKVGSGPLTLTITGANLALSAKVKFNGQILNPDTLSSGHITVTLPYAALARSGTAAVSVINAPQFAGSTSNTVFFPIAPAGRTFPYTRTVYNQVAPTSVLTADFNNDGNLDVATVSINSDGNLSSPSASDTSGNANILLGDGAGNFSALAKYPVPALASAMRTMDCNNDGNVDLVILSSSPTSSGLIVTTLLGDGSGGFRSLQGATLAQSSVTTRVQFTVGDFNGDGNVDLVIGPPVALLTLVFGDGAGQFVNPKPLPLLLGNLTLFATAAEAGDFDNDGKLDLIVGTGSVGTSPTSRTVTLLGDGEGNFRLSVVANGNGSLKSMVVGDLNNDGHPDFIFLTDTGAITSSRASVILEDPRPVPDSTSVPRSSRSGVALGDFNGDQKLDLLATGGAPNAIFTGTGASINEDAFNIPVPFDQPLNTDSSVAVGDFNGDGRLDAAVTYLRAPDSSVGALTIVLQVPQPSPRTVYVTEDVCFPYPCTATVLGENPRTVAGKGFFKDATIITRLDFAERGYQFVPSAVGSGAVAGYVAVSPTQGYLAAWELLHAEMLNIGPSNPTLPPPYINSRGDIAGTLDCGNATCPITGLIPGETLTGVRAIFDNGNILGIKSGSDIFYSAVAGVSTIPSGYLFNTDGQLLGTGSRAGTFFNAGAGFTSIPMPPDFLPQSFNTSGQIVGFRLEPGDTASPALYTVSGGVVSLNSLLSDPTNNWTLNSWKNPATTSPPPLRINNEGDILATGTARFRIGGNTVTSVVLRPQLETSSVPRGGFVTGETRDNSINPTASAFGANGLPLQPHAAGSLDRHVCAAMSLNGRPVCVVSTSPAEH